MSLPKRSCSDSWRHRAVPGALFLALTCVFIGSIGFGAESRHPYSGFDGCINSGSPKRADPSDSASCFKRKWGLSLKTNEVAKLSEYLREAKIRYLDQCPATVIQRIPAYKIRASELWCAEVSGHSGDFDLVFYRDKASRKLMDLRFLPRSPSKSS